MNSNLEFIAGGKPDETEFARRRDQCAAKLQTAVSRLIGKGFQPDHIVAGIAETLLILDRTTQIALKRCGRLQ